MLDLRAPPPRWLLVRACPATLLAWLALLAGCVAPWQRTDNAPSPQLQAEADAAYAAGNWALAVYRLQALAKSSPQDAQIRFRLGNALVRTGRLEDALTAYTESLSLEPGQPKALHNKGMAHLRLARASLQQAAQTSADPEVAGRAAALAGQLDALLEPMSP